MGRNNSHDKLPNKVNTFPKVFIDKAGRIIEIQVLNLRKLPALLKKVS